jgi:hypothetical protein
MTHERDERWAYVALAALAVAYVLYRIYVSGGGIVPVELPEVKLGEVGKGLPYLLAPLVAVLTELYRRRRARATRKEWERRVQAEGFVREEENVEIRIVTGGRGAFSADVRLTRAALYLFDRSGRRDPVRFVLMSPGPSETTVVDAELRMDDRTGRPRVRVNTSGPAGLSFEFGSVTAEAWWTDLRHGLGKTTRRDAEGQSDMEDDRGTSRWPGSEAEGEYGSGT